MEGNRVVAIRVHGHEATGETEYFEGRLFLLHHAGEGSHRAAWSPQPPANVREVAEGLIYRDFITVGLLVSRLKLKEYTGNGGSLIRDNWIYVQEPDVLVGRLQIFNNWSPYMVADPDKVWLGLEYFCNEGDELWCTPDAELIQLGREELHRIGIIDAGDVLDGTVSGWRRPTRPTSAPMTASTRSAQFVDGFENLFLIGRNGMHRYNNQDHSMLTAMVAVDNILAGETRQSQPLGDQHRAGIPRGSGESRGGRWFKMRRVCCALTRASTPVRC